MNSDEVYSFLLKVFPELFPQENSPYDLVSISENEAILGFDTNASHLRPGGTVSGPALMALVDLAMYVVVLAHIGPVELAVTTNLNINFLRKPSPGRLLGKARLLKLGRSLAVGDVIISTEAAPDVAIAHASLTYSIPPR